MLNVIKWTGSIIIIISMILTSANIYPLNIFLAIPATLCWVYVSFRWNDKSLIAMNLTALTIYLIGITHYIQSM